MKKIEKSLNKGITLIALIITIIVLLILAGIVLAMVVGDNGIIAKAQTAKERTDQTQQEELNQLNNFEEQIDTLGRAGSKINYSMNEQDTGLKWVDGKTIYQKTFEATMPSGEGAFNTIDLQNCENVINIYGWLINSNDDISIFNPTYAWFINLFFKKSTKQLYVEYSNNPTWAYNRTAYITLQYTKTTD